MHTPDQVIAGLVEGNLGYANVGKSVTEVARSFGIIKTTCDRWKNTYGPVLAKDAKLLKELLAENLKLTVTDWGILHLNPSSSEGGEDRADFVSVPVQLVIRMLALLHVR